MPPAPDDAFACFAFRARQTMLRRALTTAAARTQQPAARAAAAPVASSVRRLSAPPQQPPPPPSPEELQKMAAVSEERVGRIREGTYLTVQPPAVSDVPDLPTYMPKDPSEMAVLSDQPANQKARKAIIRQKAQTAMQSAPSKSYAWTITWPNQQRWSNPLMGWTSTADPLSNAVMHFDTAEEAMRFAQRQGWPFEVEPEIKREKAMGQKKYAFNFLAEDVENKLKREGVKTEEYKHPGSGSSNWFMPLRYHGDGECDQHGPKSGKAK